MNFKQFLNEANNVDAIINRILAETDSNYVNAFLSENLSYEPDDWKFTYIFRGTENTLGNTLNTSKHPVGRKSQNTTNEFTLLVDNLIPSWEKFPKRSESFICATAFYTAEEFGTPHLIFPFGECKIGVCSEKDLWVSMKRIQDNSTRGGSDIPDFNDAFGKIYAAACEILGEGNAKIKTLADCREAIDMVQQVLDQDRQKELEEKAIIRNVNKHLIMTLINKDKDFLNSIEWMLDSKANNLELLDISKIPKLPKAYADREIWFSNDAAFMNFHEDHDEIVDIQGRMKKLKGKK